MSIKMKSYIWLQTTDGSIQQVEEEVAMFCPVICQEIVKTGMGSSKNYAIKLPEIVNPAILGLILEYCRFHQSPGHSNKVGYFLFFSTNPTKHTRCIPLCWSYASIARISQEIISIMLSFNYIFQFLFVSLYKT